MIGINIRIGINISSGICFVIVVARHTGLGFCGLFSHTAGGIAYAGMHCEDE